MKQISFTLLLTVFFIQSVSGEKVTYSGGVAEILYKNCTSCHRQGSVGPFKLESYNDAYAYRYAIANAVKAETMPPWSPNPTYTHFKDERALSKQQIDDIINWVNDGGIRGDSTLEPHKPTYNDTSHLAVKDFSKRIEKHKVTTSLDEFRFFVLKSGLTKDAFIKQIEIIPGNRKIVHHAFLFLDTSGQFTRKIEQNPNTGVGSGGYIASVKADNIILIGGWLPGGDFYSAPDSFTFRVPRNTNYILQIHYAPGSQGQEDDTKLNIAYSTEPVQKK